MHQLVPLRLPAASTGFPPTVDSASIVNMLLFPYSNDVDSQLVNNNTDLTLIVDLELVRRRQRRPTPRRS
jgi:hypothetical protein